MIEDIEQLLTAMAEAHWGRFAAPGSPKWENLGPETRRDCRLEMTAALLAAQAEGAEMVPYGVLNKMNYAFTSYGTLPPVNPLRLASKP